MCYTPLCIASRQWITSPPLEPDGEVVDAGAGAGVLDLGVANARPDQGEVFGGNDSFSLLAEAAPKAVEDDESAAGVDKPPNPLPCTSRNPGLPFLPLNAPQPACEAELEETAVGCPKEAKPPLFSLVVAFPATDVEVGVPAALSVGLSEEDALLFQLPFFP